MTAPSLDRSTVVGDVTRDVVLYCDDCPETDDWSVVVHGLEDALQQWAEHRQRAHGEVVLP